MSGTQTFNNVPVGLTPVVTATSSTTAVISFTGAAGIGDHDDADDISNLEVIFGDAAFSVTPAANITNSTKSDFEVDFGDAVIIYTGTGFVENSNT